jgi:hypothetical protein
MHTLDGSPFGICMHHISVYLGRQTRVLGSFCGQYVNCEAGSILRTAAHMPHVGYSMCLHAAPVHLDKLQL